MANIRLGLMILVVGGMTLFALQNVSPVLPVVFLGIKTLPLPLSVWILAAIAVGVLISWVISNLFRFSNYIFVQELQARGRRRQTTGRGDPTATEVGTQNSWQPQSFRPETSYSVPPPPATAAATATRLQDSKVGAGGPPPYDGAAVDDEDDENWVDEEDVEETARVRAGGPRSYSAGDRDEEVWPEEEEESIDSPPDKTKGDRPEEEFDTERKNYEVLRSPTSQNWSGSIYSIGYRQPSDTGVAKKESVYDVDFRVITPPQTPIVEQPRSDGEDDSGVAKKESVYDVDFRVITPPPQAPIVEQQKQQKEEDDWGSSRKNKNDDWD